MSTNLKTAGVFLGGLLVGAAAVWLSPPDTFGSDTPSAPGGAAPGGAAPGGAPPGGAPPGDAPLGGAPTPEIGPAPLEDPGDVSPSEVPPELPAVVDTPHLEGGPGLLDEHIAEATDRWVEVRGRAALKLEAEVLLPRIDSLIEDIPEADEELPPVQDLVVFVVEERLLLDELSELGVDVEAEKASLESLLRPQRGQVRGGPDKAKHPGGKAPAGSRPLDPSAPRNVGG